MHLSVLIAKFLVGGLLVCAFALISEVFTPKRFAGLFSAAPSVLVAGLTVTLLATSADKAALTAQGAIAGAVGMIAYCLACTPLIRRFKALRGASLALVVWGAVALGAYGVLGKVAGW
jgi:uncharacterized membrane protein